ncbi:MAG: MFS transporter [Chloroflexi bacterium]|nr:MFS transporter [Chloroflexota bacterium]
MVIVFTTGVSSARIAPIYHIYLQDKFTIPIADLAWAFLPAGIVYGLLPSRLGRLNDRWGRAPLMAVGMTGAGAFSIALPGLPSLTWLILLCTLTAVGWAMADPALVADIAWVDKQGRAYGLYAFAHGLSATFGQMLDNICWV